MNSETGLSSKLQRLTAPSLRDDPRGARHWGASSRRKLHMRVGPSRLPLIDVARQSGQEAVLPHRRMFQRRRALPHKRAPVAALVLPGRAAAPFLFQ